MSRALEATLRPTVDRTLLLTVPCSDCGASGTYELGRFADVIHDCHGDGAWWGLTHETKAYLESLPMKQRRQLTIGGQFDIEQWMVKLEGSP